MENADRQGYSIPDAEKCREGYLGSNVLQILAQGIDFALLPDGLQRRRKAARRGRILGPQRRQSILKLRRGRRTLLAKRQKRNLGLALDGTDGFDLCLKLAREAGEIGA
jgi:hypothetical protein